MKGFTTRAVFQLMFVLLLSAPPGAEAQMKDAGLPTSGGGTTALDILLDLAASAPARAASGNQTSTARSPDRAPKDSRERLLEQLKTGTDPLNAGPPNAAAMPPQMLELEPSSKITANRAESSTSTEALNQQVEQQIAADAARKRARSAPEERLQIAEDSWIRALAYWVRDNRTMVAVIAVMTLAIIWVASALFGRARGTGSSGSASVDGWSPPPRPATRPFTRAARHRPRAHRSK